MAHDMIVQPYFSVVCRGVIDEAEVIRRGTGEVIANSFTQEDEGSCGCQEIGNEALRS